jgi:hypothetical protein
MTFISENTTNPNLTFKTGRFLNGRQLIVERFPDILRVEKHFFVFLHLHLQIFEALIAPSNLVFVKAALFVEFGLLEKNY